MQKNLARQKTSSTNAFAWRPMAPLYIDVIGRTSIYVPDTVTFRVNQLQERALQVQLRFLG
ncbi:MAG: hypothetical protein NUV63_12390 [Gallionella sp.]|nr:hypothetical protein [Gallionella sp.]